MGNSRSPGGRRLGAAGRRLTRWLPRFITGVDLAPAACPLPWAEADTRSPRNCKPGIRSLRTGARGAQQRPSPSLEGQGGGLPGGGDISGKKKMKRTEPVLRRSLTGGKPLRVPLPGSRPGTPRAHQALPQPLPGGSPPGLRACTGASPSAFVPFPRDEPQHVRGRDTPSVTTQDIPTTS